jgi:hypothetical protein
MTQQFYFNIQKFVPSRKCRSILKTKNVIVTADDFEQARRFLTEDFPEWAVSMYWPWTPGHREHPDITYTYINRQWRD